MSKKKSEVINQERIFASLLKAGQKIMCDDGTFRTVVKVDPVLDPNSPTLTINEIIAYVDYSPQGKITPELKKDSIVVKIE